MRALLFVIHYSFQMVRPGILFPLGLLLLSACQNRDPMALPEKVDYNFHIRPILADNCFACHGPDANERKADLRLDTEEGAFAALKDAPGQFALVPGQPAQSEVYLRVSHTDSSELMPPPESNLSLSDRDIAMIEKWIEQGAEYKKH